MSRYSDFYINFNVHPIKGDLAAITDAASVTQRIKNLVYTDKYERPFAPNRGAGIPATLFDNIYDTDVEFMLQTRIKDAIAADEPAAINVVVNVVANTDRNSYSATIIYTPINTNIPVTIDVIFERIR